jgi:hypothetical protein
VQNVPGDLPCLFAKKSWDSSNVLKKNGSDTRFPIVKQTQAINHLNSTNMCFMYVQKERESDSENFGTRITGFGVVVEKIWSFDVSGAIL